MLEASLVLFFKLFTTTEMPIRPSISRSNVSRQFTDVERDLDDRVANVLSSTPVSGAIGGSMGQTYHWLKQDLETRSMLDDTLAKEQGMAYAQSTRQELARKSDEEEANKQRSIAALRKVKDLTGRGTNFNDAVSQVTEEDPELALTPQFTSGVTEFGKYHENDEDRELRELKDKAVKWGLTKQTFDAEAAARAAEEDPEGMDRLIALNRKNLANQELSAVNAGLIASTERMARQREFDKQTALQDTWSVDAAGNDDDPVSADDAQARLHYSFAKAGLPDVDDPREAVRQFGAKSAIVGMLANKDFLDQKAAEAGDPAAFRQSITEAINTASDKGADPVAKRKSRSLLLTLAGDNQARLAEVAKTKERLAVLDADNKELTTSYKDASADIASKLGGTGDKKERASAVIGAARGFIDQYRASAPPGQEALFDEYSAYFDKLSETESPEKVATKARELMGNFITSLKGKGVASTQAVAKPAEAKPAAVNQRDQALQWLKANPNDPRAAAVKAKLGVK